MAQGTLSELDKARVGWRLRVIREAKGWQQNHFAEMIKEDPTKLANYESGRHLLPTLIGDRVCALSGADFDYLYRGIGRNIDPKFMRELTAAESRLAKQDESPKRGPKPKVEKSRRRG